MWCIHKTLLTAKKGGTCPVTQRDWTCYAVLCERRSSQQTSATWIYLGEESKTATGRKHNGGCMGQGESGK